MTAEREVPCKEPGCNQTVTYERKVVRGFKQLREEPRHVSVYLTCANDHTHKYEFDKFDKGHE